MKAVTVAYAPVRLCIDSQREWIAISEIGLLDIDARICGQEHDKRLPTFAEDNPIVRIVKVKIEEE